MGAERGRFGSMESEITVVQQLGEFTGCSCALPSRSLCNSSVVTGDGAAKNRLFDRRGKRPAAPRASTDRPCGTEPSETSVLKRRSDEQPKMIERSSRNGTAVVLFAVKRMLTEFTQMLEERVIRPNRGPPRAQRQFGARIEAVPASYPATRRTADARTHERDADLRVFKSRAASLTKCLQSMAAFIIQRAAGVKSD